MFFLAWVHSVLVLLPSLFLQSLFSCPVPPFPSTGLAMVLLWGMNVNQRVPMTQKSLTEPSLTSLHSAARCLPNSHIILNTSSLVCSKRRGYFLNFGALCCCTAYYRVKSRSCLHSNFSETEKCKGTYRRNTVMQFCGSCLTVFSLVSQCNLTTIRLT